MLLPRACTVWGVGAVQPLSTQSASRVRKYPHVPLFHGRAPGRLSSSRVIAVAISCVLPLTAISASCWQSVRVTVGLYFIVSPFQMFKNRKRSAAKYSRLYHERNTNKNNFFKIVHSFTRNHRIGTHRIGTHRIGNYPLKYLSIIERIACNRRNSRNIEPACLQLGQNSCVVEDHTREAEILD